MLGPAQVEPRRERLRPRTDALRNIEERAVSAVVHVEKDEPPARTLRPSGRPPEGGGATLREVGRTQDGRAQDDGSMVMGAWWMERTSATRSEGPVVRIRRRSMVAR